MDDIPYSVRCILMVCAVPSCVWYDGMNAMDGLRTGQGGGVEGAEFEEWILLRMALFIDQ
jgi:hypothetical protein